MDSLDRAIAKLKSFTAGDNGVMEVVACGNRAIPLLRALLFSREPSGLFQARVRAIDALARLDARDILVEYLGTPREIYDPVERLGEDAVINAAARALANQRDPRVLDLLLRLAQRPCLTGVIYALGAFRATRAIPLLVEALAEDASRLTAEIALKKIGASARAALIEAAIRRSDEPSPELESRLRQRRSALRLLLEMGASRRVWQAVKSLKHDEDVQIAVLACELGLSSGSPTEKREAARCLVNLATKVDWALHDEIERYLVSNIYIAKDPQMQVALSEGSMAESDAAKDFAKQVLRRIRS
jgi:hypothetical protein